jgi:hypothetical protein
MGTDPLVRTHHCLSSRWFEPFRYGEDNPGAVAEDDEGCECEEEEEVETLVATVSSTLIFSLRYTNTF